MTDDLGQRIDACLELLKLQADICGCDTSINWICNPCFIHGVICEMKREREVLQKQRDVAVRDLANYRSVVNGAILNQTTRSVVESDD